MNFVEDLTGQKFDSLYVKEFDPEASKKYRQSFWKCICDCGREVSVSGYRLINKLKRNCGHCNDPKPGDVFDYYTVKCYNEAKSKEKHHAFYDCECICGNIRTVAKSDLINKKATNCGCIASLNKRDTEDITNKRFTHWVAERYNEEESKKTGSTMWDCVCDCGTRRTVSISALKSKKSTSCGCAIGEYAKDRAKKRENERPNWKLLKEVYHSMMYRCNPKNKNKYDYRNYAGKGITVCERWADPEHGFDNFYNDMIDTYIEGYSIDRIDSDGNYSPDNCRWIKFSYQNYNKNTNNIWDHYGMLSSSAEILRYSKELYKDIGIVVPDNINSQRFNSRLNAGYTPEEALFVPKRLNKDKYTRDNKIVKIPFVFKERFEALGIIRSEPSYHIPTKNELEEYYNNLPLAGNFLKGYTNIQFNTQDNY